MLKFLRKYSKALLIFFGVLLMIAFTAPQAIQQLGNRLANRKVANINGSAVHMQEVQLAERQYALLRERLPSQVLPVVDRDRVGLHWMMLRREAEAAGLVGVAGDGALWVEDFAPQIARQQVEIQLAQQLGPQLAAQFAGQQWNSMAPAERQAMIDRIAGFLSQPPSGATEREYHEALSVARGVHRLTNGYFESAPLSDTRAVRESADLQRLAMVEAFWVSGRDVAGIAGDPTDEQLREHYERFASTPLGGGEFGIGYTLPERLKIEYLKLDRDAILANITPDPLEVRKRYQVAAREDDAAGREPEAFEDARERIERRVRNEVADDVIKTAQQAFVGAMGEATRTLQSEGPYKRLPDDFDQARPSFEAIAQSMVEAVALSRFPEARGGTVELPMPEIVRPERWLWPSAMQELEGFGQAQISVGSTRAPIAQVLYAVRELRPEMGASLAIQKGLPVSDIPATDAAGSMYFYTVLDVRDESRPDDMSEIRPQLVEDWQALRAFEMLGEQAEQTEQIAAADGLTAAAVRLMDALGASAEAPTPQTVRVSPSAVVETGTFQPQPVPAINAEAFRDAVMGVFESLDPLVDITQTPREQRTVAVPIPNTLTLAVGTVDTITPLTAEIYRRMADNLDYQLRLMELREALPAGNPFSFDAMSQRLNLELIGSDDEPADQDAGEPGEG
jgi:hypothetical protein